MISKRPEKSSQRSCSGGGGRRAFCGRRTFTAATHELGAGIYEVVPGFTTVFLGTTAYFPAQHRTHDPPVASTRLRGLASAGFEVYEAFGQCRIAEPFVEGSERVDRWIRFTRGESARKLNCVEGTQPVQRR